MKRKKSLFLVAPLVCLIALTAGCSFLDDKVSVTSINKTASYSTEDVYTVTYSDGTSSDFTVQNGKDVSVQDLFERYKQEYGDTLTYDEFLKKYLTFTSESSESVVGKALLSSFKISTANSYGAAAGSAVLYAVNEEKNDAYILTNYHVTYVSNSYGNGALATSISCALFGNDTATFSCTYIGGCASSDIALVRARLSELKTINDNIKPVTLSSDYSVGETVYAIGNTDGKGISATRGIISVDSENVDMSIGNKTRSHRVMRIDAAIYHGNSGGGLFNVNGELVGITNGGNETEQNINYAIPLSVVKGTADNILHYYADGNSSTSGAYKIMLGVNIKTQNSRYIYNESSGKGHVEEEIVVTGVTASSIASSLGLWTSDILTEVIVNETSFPIYRSHDIYDALLTARAGDGIKIGYKRLGIKKTSSAYTIKSSDLAAIE